VTPEKRKAARSGETYRADSEDLFSLETKLVLGNLLGHLNRSGVLAVLGDFLLALDVGSAAATLRLLTMLLTHGGMVVLFVGQAYGLARVDISGF
jgi:hypothetical protein